MSELIIHSQIISKKTLGKIVNRDRLTRLLADNINKALILICCPAGYGKTTLVQEFLLWYEKHSAWFHVSDNITNFYTFISYIVHSLRLLKNEFGEKVFKVIESLKETSNWTKDLNSIITTIIGTLTNEFIKIFQEDTILVIDDLHNLVKNDWTNLAFKTLLEYLPENFHIIVTTRLIPDFDLSVLRAKRNICELGINELAFTNKEIEDLLKSIYSMKHTINDVQLIEVKLKGWITGIHLILQAYGSEFKKAEFESDVIPENLYNFFANEIFNNLDKVKQNFLLSTALLDNFTFDLCNRLLSTSNSKLIIEELVNKNIFIEISNYNEQGIKINEPSFSYYSLFKQFLLTKLKELKTQNEIMAIAEKIADYFKEKKEITSAIDYLFIAQNYSEAISHLKSLYQELIDSGRFEVLWNWIEKLPEEYLLNEAILNYLKGVTIKYFQGDIELSLKFFNKALQLPETSSNNDLYMDLTMQKSECLKNLGNIDESVNLLNKALEKDPTPGNKIKLLFFLADTYYRIGYSKYEEIIAIINEGLGICDRMNIIFYQSEMYNLLGNVYHDRGDFIKSLFYFEIVERSETNIVKKFNTLTNIVFLHSYSGNFSKANEYIDKTKELYKLFPALSFERSILRAEASFRFECGDYEHAITLYEKLSAIDLSKNLKSFVFWYYLFIGESYLLLSNFDKASQYYELALNFKEDNNEYQLFEYNLHKALLNKQNRYDEDIEKTLLDALEYFENNNLTHSKVQIEFQLADLYLKKGYLETSFQYLSSSLDKAFEKKYISFLEQLFVLHRYLFDFAVSNNLQVESISGIISELKERQQFDWISDEYRKRLIKESDKINDITLNTFGGADQLRLNPAF